MKIDWSISMFDSEFPQRVEFDINELKRLSFEEINNIKNISTANELMRIDIKNFNSRGYNIYDMLTGNRFTKRGFNLMLACGVEYSRCLTSYLEPLKNYQIEFSRNGNIKVNNFTALEIYLDQFDKSKPEDEYKLCQMFCNMKNVLLEPLIF